MHHLAAVQMMFAMRGEPDVRAWLDDDRVVTLCLARPANAMAAIATGRPLTSGVVRRWSVASSYRHHALAAVEAVLVAMGRDDASNLVLCGQDRDGHVVAGPIWCPVSGRDRPDEHRPF